MLHNGPVYIRSSRIDVPCIFDENYKFDYKKAVKLQEGSDITVIGSGDIMSEVILASEILQQSNISVDLINVPVIKPLDNETIIESAKKY